MRCVFQQSHFFWNKSQILRLILRLLGWGLKAWDRPWDHPGLSPETKVSLISESSQLLLTQFWPNIWNIIFWGLYFLLTNTFLDKTSFNPNILWNKNLFVIKIFGLKIFWIQGFFVTFLYSQNFCFTTFFWIQIFFFILNCLALILWT